MMFFITKFTPSAPRAGKPVPWIGYLPLSLFYSMRGVTNTNTGCLTFLVSNSTELKGRKEILGFVMQLVNRQWKSTHSEIAFSIKQCSNFKFCFCKQFRTLLERVQIVCRWIFLLCRKFIQ